MNRVLAVVGATATGKTELGELLAAARDGEVVCVDSRQVYAELEIGTGKPSREQRTERPHHLFDALRLGQRASAGWYGRVCGEARREVRGRDRLPILVGGSGLYLRAARAGLAAEPPHDPGMREWLGAEMETLGPEALHARLAVVDPATAARLGPRDRQRIGRALEVHAISGRPLSWWHAQPMGPDSGERWVTLELVVPASVVRERIIARTRAMFEQGLVEETRALLAAGHGDALRALRAVGYDEAMGLLEGRLTRTEAEERTNLRTAQLAKRQRTWFRHQVEAVRLSTETADLQALMRSALETIDRGT